MNEYRGYKFCLMVTTPAGEKFWVIADPSGERGPPAPFPGEDSVRAEIDRLITSDDSEGGPSA